jgi:MFS family permease
MSLRPGEESAAAAERWPEERTDWLGVAFGLALSCFVAFQQFKLPPVLPELLQTFHYPRELAAGFMSVYALIGLLGSVPLGRWLKRRGYRAGLPLGIASTALGLVLALVFARFGAVLLLARALEGVTYAVFAIAGPVIATGSARFRDLPLVTGLLAGWIPVGQIVAGLLALAVPQGHALTQALGLADWQVTWLAALALTLLLGLFCWRFSHHQDVSSVNSRAKARRTVTADTESVKSAPATVSSVTGPAPAAGSGPGGGRNWPGLLSAGTFLLWSCQFFAFMTWLTQYLKEQHNLQQQTAILVYLIPVVVLLGFNLLTGWALGRGLSLMPALITGLALQGVVWVLAPFLNDVTGVMALVVYGICSGIIPTCLFHLPHHIAAHRHQLAAGPSTGQLQELGIKAGPEAFATLMTGRNIGVFFGPLLLPQLLGWLGQWNLAAQAIALVTWLAGGLVLILARHLR